MQTAEMIDRALAEACARMGFCTRLSGVSLLKKYNGKMTAHDFAASLHYAEGLNFEYSKHTKQLEAIFRKFVKKHPSS
jgi:hypothetical protein